MGEVSSVYLIQNQYSGGITMILCNGIELTEELIEEIGTAVCEAGEIQLLQYLKRRPDLIKGVRLKASNYPLFRKRISAFLKNRKELDEDDIHFLYNAGLGQAFVVVLSIEALKLLVNEFHAWFGASFALALLLDPREEVQEIGGTLINQDLPYMTRDKARKSISDTMDKFASLYIPICNQEVIPETVTNHDSEQLQDVERKLKVEEKRNKELSQRLIEEKERYQQKLDDKVMRVDAMAAEIEQLRREVSRLKLESSDLYNQLNHERSSSKATINEQVRQQLNGLTNEWLCTRISTDQEAIKTNCNDLLAEADLLLEHQAQIDRHIGNKITLSQRLETITGKLKEVRNVLSNAINPLPRLAVIEKHLLEEKEHLEQALQVKRTAEVSQLAEALAARINVASDDTTLQHLERLCCEIKSMGLSATDNAYLQQCFCNRYDRLIAKHKHKEDYREIKPQNSAVSFHVELAQGRQVMLVCDGHNILNSLDEFREVRNRSHAEARAALSGILAEKLGGYESCHCTVVFDGPDHTTAEVSRQVSVIYSGGGKSEKHRADKRIEELLTWRRYADKKNSVYVVSADNDVVREAKHNGAKVINLDQFGWMIS